jgi:hypothetical protein
MVPQNACVFKFTYSLTSLHPSACSVQLNRPACHTNTASTHPIEPFAALHVWDAWKAYCLGGRNPARIPGTDGQWQFADALLLTRLCGGGIRCTNQPTSAHARPLLSCALLPSLQCLYYQLQVHDVFLVPVHHSCHRARGHKLYSRSTYIAVPTVGPGHASPVSLFPAVSPAVVLITDSESGCRPLPWQPCFWPVK